MLGKGEKQSERNEKSLTFSMVPDKTSSADNIKGCGKIFLLNAYEVDEQDWECGRYCPVCKEIHLCPSCKEKNNHMPEDNLKSSLKLKEPVFDSSGSPSGDNSSKDKVSNDEGVSCLPASPLNAFSDEVLKNKRIEIYNKYKPKVLNVDKLKKDKVILIDSYSFEDLQNAIKDSFNIAISLTAQKMQEITNQDITNFYKDKEINYADALLFKTAQNNFKAGQEAQKKEMQKEIDELKKTEEKQTALLAKRYIDLEEEWNEKVKKLKEELTEDKFLATKGDSSYREYTKRIIDELFGGKE
jgi:hypothetical protein